MNGEPNIIELLLGIGIVCLVGWLLGFFNVGDGSGRRS